MKKARSHRQVRDALFLAHCTVSEAVRWLETRPEECHEDDSFRMTLREDHLPEYILLRRGDPIIDIALAEFGRSRTVLKMLYSRSSHSLRTVLCANASLFVGGTLTFQKNEKFAWKIVEHGRLSELRSVCCNSGMPKHFYLDMTQLWHPHEVGNDVNEERFQVIVQFLGENPLLQHDTANSLFYILGENDFYYIYCALRNLWGLSEVVDVNEGWAEILWDLYGKIAIASAMLKNASAIAARWKKRSKAQSDIFDRVAEAIHAASLRPVIKEITFDDPASINPGSWH